MDSSQKKIQQTEDQINKGKAEEDEAIKKIVEIDRRTLDLAVQVQKLKAELAERIGEKAQAESRLSALYQEIARTKRELDSEKARLARDKKVLNDRVRRVYESGAISYAGVLLNSSSFEHFLNRLAFLRMIVKQNARLVRKVQMAEAAVAAKQRQQEQEKQAIEADRAVVVADADRIDQLKVSQEQQLAYLQADKAQKQALVEKLKQDEVALVSVQQMEKANAHAIQEQIRRWNAQVEAEARQRAPDSSRGKERSAPPVVPPQAGWVWSPGVDGSVLASVRQAIEQECARQGINPGPVEEIVNRESGGDPYAVNLSSGAAGLFQRVPGDSIVLGDIVGQVRDGVTYIRETYGTSEAALAWWNGHGWY
ncbi:MAG: hypothetical protein M1548_03320 [Actinobacteria bacterium]|nr:hypothetical protein [Actinomycetota bacterium]